MGKISQANPSYKLHNIDYKNSETMRTYFKNGAPNHGPDKNNIPLVQHDEVDTFDLIKQIDSLSNL